jgi:thioredoxin reductase (NADPH)
MQQISPFNARFHLGQMAIRLEKREPCEGLPAGGWRVVTNAGERIDCKVLVIAAGGGRLMPAIPAIKGVGYDTHENLIPVDTGNFQTSIPGS